VRLLYSNNYLYRRGGSERVMFDEAEWFAARGHQTFFFGHRHAECEHMPFASLFPEPVEYAALRGLRKARAAARIVYNVDARWRLRPLVRALHPELMHCHNIYSGLTVAILDEAKRQGVPSLVTLHDYKLACPSYLMLSRGEVCESCVDGSVLNCVARRCHKESLLASAVAAIEAIYASWARKWYLARFWICPSSFLRSIMIRRGYPAERLRHVPNGLDLTEWPAGTGGDEGYALYVGRLSHEKGIEALVRASVGARMPLRVIGQGPERSRLEALAERLGANVRFEGHRSSSELRPLLRGAACLVVPSIWYENAPMTIIEAMASGKPVIGSAIGGIPEMVEDGETGLLVPPGDIERLRDAMEKLAGDDGLRRAMGRAARRSAEVKFSLDVHAERLSAIYEEALSA
jgi:glycosyltransferase involved in cell wall biosynthesis